jgi:hypothetical protein
MVKQNSHALPNKSTETATTVILPSLDIIQQQHTTADTAWRDGAVSMRPQLIVSDFKDCKIKLCHCDYLTK